MDNTVDIKFLMTLGTIVMGAMSFAWYMFDYQKKNIIDPIRDSIATQQLFKEEVKEIKATIHKIETELKTRLTIKDGTPIEQVIEKMSEQFDLMIDRDMFNFYMDSQPKFECDSNGLCTRVNNKWVELTGITEAHALGNGWMGAIHQSDQHRVYNAWDDFIQKDFPFDIKYKVMVDGVVVNVHGRAFSKREKKNIRLILGTFEICNT